MGKKKIVKRVERDLGQHQTSNTLSNSRESLEEGEEKLPTERNEVKACAGPSTTLRCCICDHLGTETQEPERGEAFCSSLFPSPHPAFVSQHCGVIPCST